MNNLNQIRDSIEKSIGVKRSILADEKLLSTIAAVIEVMVSALRKGNRIIFAGNGGSAADAQHLAAELVSRFEFDRPGLPSLSLATDTSMITAIGNDYGYEKLFQRQLEAQSKPGDVFVGLTTSGRSKNILSAFQACGKLGVRSLCLCGQGGELEGLVDFIIRVPSLHTARIQESHIMIGHIICAELELAMFNDFRIDKKTKS